MKILLFLLLPIALFGQKSSPIPYLKASPTIYLPDGEKTAYGFTSSVGYRGRFIAGGLALGAYKLCSNEEGVYLIGTEFIATDFKSKNIRPILTLAAYYPFFKDEFNTWQGSNNIETNTKANFHWESSLGISIPVRRTRINLTAGFSWLGFKNKIVISNGPIKVYKNEKSSLSMATISVGLIL